MLTRIVIGLALGWLIAGVVVLSIAFESEHSGGPLSASDIPVLIVGVALWPWLLFPEEGDDA
jgi:hypothetical protein